MKSRFESWGRVSKAEHKQAVQIEDPTDLSKQLSADLLYLPYGKGRSYGDSCLNDEGGLLLSKRLNSIHSFDEVSGLIECGSGVSFRHIIERVLPKSWFLPVTPGTQCITVGGAIANDIHGKNHHVAGNFGRWVKSFTLARSDGSTVECRPDHNADLFAATIGGLGLTGMILSAEFQLIPFMSSQLDVESVRFSSFEEYLELSAESDQSFEYVVSWVDTLSKSGKERGVLLRANAPKETSKAKLAGKAKLGVPFSIPTIAMNRLSIGLFNKLYNAQFPKENTVKTQSYRPYFYPLDSVNNWNRVYGKNGLYQFQLVIPHDRGIEHLREIFRQCESAGQASFLTVLKNFGDLESPGLMSFPRPGITLNLDFANKGGSTKQLLTTLDDVVRDAGGAVYPAKDATMSPQSFKQYFPRWKEFSTHVDPHFSSSFWRRVVG